MSKTALGKFGGREVVAAKVKVTNAGDGLSKAVAVDPVGLDIGDKVYVVLECDVADVGFSPAKDDGRKLVRTHALKTLNATIVDEDLVRAHLDDQAERIEKAAGVHRLPLDGDGDEGEGGE